jgi:hypothetical protein
MLVYWQRLQRLLASAVNLPAAGTMGDGIGMHHVGA